MFTVTVKQNFEWETIEGLIFAGVEGGADYWLTIEGETSSWNDICNNLQETIEQGKFTLSNRSIVEDVGEASEEVLITKTITLAHIQEALQIMADKYPVHFESLAEDDYDAETGDVFLQILVLGEVLYG